MSRKAKKGRGGRVYGRLILTACSLDELVCGMLRLFLLEVDNGERRAARLDERTTELVPKTARSAGHDGHLSAGRGARTMSGG